MSSRSSTPARIHVIVDEQQVANALESPPIFLSEQGVNPFIRALYNWISNLVSLLYEYVVTMFGTSNDRIEALEASVAVLQAKPHSQPAPPIPNQPRHSSKSIRCQRCHSIGHAAIDCRTKDPVAVKKRVVSTQKAVKEMERRRIAATLPSRLPFDLHDYFGDPVIRRPLLPDRTSTRSMTALAVDATELRRRKIQSTRDKRRRAASSTNTTT